MDIRWRLGIVLMVRSGCSHSENWDTSPFIWWLQCAFLERCVENIVNGNWKPITTRSEGLGMQAVPAFQVL